MRAFPRAPRAASCRAESARHLGGEGLHHLLRVCCVQEHDLLRRHRVDEGAHHLRTDAGNKLRGRALEQASIFRVLRHATAQSTKHTKHKEFVFSPGAATILQHNRCTSVRYIYISLSIFARRFGSPCAHKSGSRLSASGHASRCTVAEFLKPQRVSDGMEPSLLRRSWAPSESRANISHGLVSYPVRGATEPDPKGATKWNWSDAKAGAEARMGLSPCIHPSRQRGGTDTLGKAAASWLTKPDHV